MRRNWFGTTTAQSIANSIAQTSDKKIKIRNELLISLTEQIFSSAQSPRTAHSQHRLFPVGNDRTIVPVNYHFWRRKLSVCHVLMPCRCC